MCAAAARARWQLGSLSHYLNTEAMGYMPLSDFPKEPPDPSVRDVKVCSRDLAVVARHIVSLS